MKNPKSPEGIPKNPSGFLRNKIQNPNFYPLTLIRSIEELRCGARALADHPERKPDYLWDLIVHLGEDLEDDFRVLGKGLRGKVHPSVAIYNSENILIEEGAEVEALAVLDARSGPIYVGRNSIIRPHAYLRGPLSVGPECRIGGEATHSIFHGYSNKQHYGFIGHSYIGEWVNLGAGTTNSNLKNNYGTVKVNVKGKEIDSGEQFLGCFIGDFAKLGIGTLIATGAVIGVAANIFAGGVTPKFVPSFSWGEKTVYDLEKAISSAKIVAARRGRTLEKEEAILRRVFELTKSERKGFKTL